MVGIRKSKQAHLICPRTTFGKLRPDFRVIGMPTGYHANSALANVGIDNKPEE